ncbi:Adenylate cyclase 2 [Thauera sp. GDN1]|uniref:response regulator n=1 Tax=Thauera sp. GDN1 TaxID=2944810 RepID=UPI0024791144|nr:response regulator [Thauera sp. GDN1]WEN42145.1 Adenylate cyclase 2 [Thauera sp. GDN1]
MQDQPTDSTQPQALVVEDDPLYATLYREILVSMVPGIEVMVAENGYLALLHLAQHRPGVVILDLHMPGFDGFEFLDIVKRKRTLVDVPVIVVSSATDTATKRLHDLPSVHVFAKPLRPALLQKLVRQVLPSAASATPPRHIPSAFDASQFEAFVGPDWHLQRQIARQFYELAPDRIAKLEQDAHRLDYEALLGWCHTLTGTAAMIGANALGDCVERLHHAVECRDPAAIRTEADLVIRELRHVAVVFDHDFALDDADS